MSRCVTIDRARLWLGDNAQILPGLGRFDRLITDPPYAFDTSGGGRFRAARGHTDDIAAQGLDQGFDHAIVNPLQFAAAILFVHNDQLHEVLPHLAGCYQRYALCFWRKSNPMPVANRHYQPDSEIYVHAWSQGHHPEGDLAEKKRVWDGPVGRRREFDHPTVKPLDLMRKIVRNAGGESICDPFMGTGTTGVAAIEAGKSFVGIERDPKHFETACRRIRAAAEREACHV